MSGIVEVVGRNILQYYIDDKVVPNTKAEDNSIESGVQTRAIIRSLR